MPNYCKDCACTGKKKAAHYGLDGGLLPVLAVCLQGYQLAPGETWGFSKRKWGLKSGGKSPPREQKWELKVGV